MPRPRGRRCWPAIEWQTGEFVYAVESTGVYCRPGCPSRRPSRQNVRFFTSCEQAEAAGFRACLRCKPTTPNPAGDAQAEAVSRAAALLSARDGEPLAAAELARAVGLSRFALLRGFQRVLGVTPSEFARAQKRERFRTTSAGWLRERSRMRCMQRASDRQAACMRAPEQRWGCGLR